MKTDDDKASDFDKNDEVTFLLRLRPTPPSRRKRGLDVKPNVSVHTTAPKGWDVVIEQKELDNDKIDKKPPLSPPSSRSPRASHDYQNDNHWDDRGSSATNWPKKGKPPEIAPRTSSLENSERKIGLLRDLFNSPTSQRRRNHAKFSQFTSCFGDKSSDNVNGDDFDLRSPPPLPPRFRPSAPPQELVDSVMWHPKPYYPIYRPYFASVYDTAHLINFNLSEPICNSNGNRNGNGNLPGENFNRGDARNSGPGLISSYGVVQPLSAPSAGSRASNTPSPSQLRPPKPLPRQSAANKISDSLQASGFVKSRSELALHLLVSIKNVFNALIVTINILNDVSNCNTQKCLVTFFDNVCPSR